MNKPKIVILGAGYGGLITSKRLEKLIKDGEADITLINKHDYHYITTQLHKTGVGTASDQKITLAIPELIDQSKIEFKKATIASINKDNQYVTLESGEKVLYDYLLVSLGFDVETFGIPGIQEHAFQIRSFRSTKMIYNHIRKQLSLYLDDQDPSRLTFVVAGGGFTGIEMLGELAEGLPKLCKEYGVPFENTRIIGIEAAPALLPWFGKEAIQYTTELLEKYGVEIMTSTKILECTSEQITINDDQIIPTRTLVWSCGVRGNRILENAGLPIVRTKVPVGKDLRVQGQQNIFCIGDSALFMTDEKDALPPTAQVAIQQALVCAENIAAAIRGKELTEFEYHHKGSVASIGIKAAIGKIGNFRITGLFGAFMKQVIEMRYLFVLGGIPLIIRQNLGLKPAPTKVAAKQ